MLHNTTRKTAVSIRNQDQSTRQAIEPQRPLCYPIGDMPINTRQNLIGGLGLLLFFAALTTAMYALFTSDITGANDFYPRWKGAVLYWQEGVDPYSDAATEAIQRGMYGGQLARPDQDQALFVYPFYTVFLLLPLVWLPYAWVQAMWMALLLMMLIGGVIICLRLLEWRPPLWLLAVTLLWAVLFYSSARTIILGQFAGLVFFCFVASLLALRAGRDGAAAVLLALTTVKPQMVFLLLPALLLWGVGRRRWRFVGGFALALAALAGASFLLLPGWLGAFVTQVVTYPSYTVVGSPTQIVVTYYAPWLGQTAVFLFGLLMVAWMLWQWRRLPHTPLLSDEFVYILGVTLLVTNLVSPQTATTNYVLLYLPLLWLLHKVGRGWQLAFFAVSLAGMWWLFLATVQGDAEDPIMFLPLPALLLASLAWAGWRRAKRPSASPVEITS